MNETKTGHSLLMSEIDLKVSLNVTVATYSFPHHLEPDTPGSESTNVPCITDNCYSVVINSFKVDISMQSFVEICVFGLTCLLQVSLKENGRLSKDSNVTMEIPIHATIAYSLLELEIKHDGRYGEKSFTKFIH